MSSDRPPKEIIAQRYRLIEQIGKGGMGSVWRAEHTSLRTSVAIKLLDPRLANEASLRARFLREAQAAAALTSVHIVRILDHGVDDDVPYIAMEFLPGESLRECLRREGTLSPAASAKIFAGVARAMSRAHRAGIVHRDLKPDNIFIAHDDEQGEVVKVLDFGIAKMLETKLRNADDTESLATATGTVLGTPFYMSPEQLRGKKEVDARSDLWALGVIAFECLTGTRPFVADALGELVLKVCSDPPPVPSTVASVPKGFDEWFLQAIAVDVDVRFQTVQELARALADVLSPGENWLPNEPEPNASSPRFSRPSAAAGSHGTPVSGAPLRVQIAVGSGGVRASTALGSDDEGNVLTATGAAHSLPSTPGREVVPEYPFTG